MKKDRGLVSKMKWREGGLEDDEKWRTGEKMKAERMLGNWGESDVRRWDIEEYERKKKGQEKKEEECERIEEGIEAWEDFIPSQLILHCW